jgi:hypothetical protein
MQILPMEHRHLPVTNSQHRDSRNNGQGNTLKVLLKHRSNKQLMAVGGPSPTRMQFHLPVQLQHQYRGTNCLKCRGLALLARRLDLLSSETRKNFACSSILLLRPASRTIA